MNAMSYPNAPGVRAGSADTAREAAVKIAPIAPTYEAACLAYVEAGPITPDEAHAKLEKERGHTIPLYSIRPRFSCLAAKGLIKDSGERRAPPGGCKAVVWVATDATERALFAAQRAADREHGGDR